MCRFVPARAYASVPSCGRQPCCIIQHHTQHHKPNAGLGIPGSGAGISLRRNAAHHSHAVKQTRNTGSATALSICIHASTEETRLRRPGFAGTRVVPQEHAHRKLARSKGWSKFSLVVACVGTCPHRCIASDWRLCATRKLPALPSVLPATKAPRAASLSRYKTTWLSANCSLHAEKEKEQLKFKNQTFSVLKHHPSSPAPSSIDAL